MSGGFGSIAARNPGATSAPGRWASPRIMRSRRIGRSPLVGQPEPAWQRRRPLGASGLDLAFETSLLVLLGRIEAGVHVLGLDRQRRRSGVGEPLLFVGSLRDRGLQRGERLSIEEPLALGPDRSRYGARSGLDPRPRARRSGGRSRRCGPRGPPSLRDSPGRLEVGGDVRRADLGIALVEPGGREEGEHPVVVRLRDRVELVVVAAGAVRRVRPRMASPTTLTMSSSWSNRSITGSAGSSSIRPRRNRPVADGELIRVASGELVAGELLGEEAVVGQVVVEGVDDPVAIAPGVGLGVVALVAVRSRRSGRRRASAAPSARRNEGWRAADRPAARRRRGARRARNAVDLRRSGRQADQVEGEPADQGPSVGLGRRAEPLLPQRPDDKAVDRVLAAIAEFGNRGPADGRERPERSHGPKPETLPSPLR